MAEGGALILLPQIPVGVELDHSQVGMEAGGGADGGEGQAVLTADGDEKFPGLEMRPGGGFDLGQSAGHVVGDGLEVGCRVNALEIGLPAELLVVPLHLMGGREDRRRPVGRALAEAGGPFEGDGEDDRGGAAIVPVIGVEEGEVVGFSRVLHGLRIPSLLSRRRGETG